MKIQRTTIGLLGIMLILYWLVLAIYALDNGFSAGNEYQINNYTSGLQRTPVIASNGTNFFVAWESMSDKSGYGRILDASGTPVGSSDILISYNTYAQHPWVASDGTNYMVSYSSYRTSTMSDIRAKLYDGQGNPIGTTIEVNQTSALTQRNSVVASNGSTYLIAWEHKVADNDYDVYARIFDATGNPLTDEFCINIHNEMDQMTIAVASDGTNYLVAWENEYDDGTSYGHYDGMRGRIVHPDGTMEASEIIFMGGYQLYPHLTFDGTNYLLTWINWFGQSVYGQFVGVDGSLYTAFKVDTGYQYNQYHPRSAFNGQNFCVVWIRYDGSDQNVYGQLLDNNTSGVKIGSEFQVPSDIAGNQTGPSVAAIGSNYLAVYESNQDIFARYFSSDTLFITEQPQNTIAQEGTDASFSVTVDPRGYPLSYQWYADGTPIGLDNDTLVIEDVFLENDGTVIHCVISDSQGSVTSGQAVLSVLPDPSFTLVIDGPDKVVEGGEAYYTATAVYVHSTVDVTSDVTWSVVGSDAVLMNSDGMLSVLGSISESVSLTVSADYYQDYVGKNVALQNLFQILMVYPWFPDTFSAQPDEIMLLFSETIDADSLATSGATVIKGSGPDNMFDTADDLLFYPIIDVAGAQLTYYLNDGESHLPNDTYRIILGNITNIVGDVLDGEDTGVLPSGDGEAGGDYVIEFTIARTVSSMVVEDNDSVTLAWEPFEEGLQYTVEYMDSSGVWQVVEPVEQWPISDTSWNGDPLAGDEKVRLYRVTGSLPYIKSILPASGVQGSSLTVDISGYGTEWSPSIAVSFGDGITVSNVVVTDSEHLIVTIYIAVDAALGGRTVIVGEQSKSAGFAVE